MPCLLSNRTPFAKSQHLKQRQTAVRCTTGTNRRLPISDTGTRNAPSFTKTALSCTNAFAGDAAAEDAAEDKTPRTLPHPPRPGALRRLPPTGTRSCCAAAARSLPGAASCVAAGSGTGKWSVLRAAPGLQLPEGTCGPAAVRGWQPPSGSAGPHSAPRPRAARLWCRRRSPGASPRGGRPAASLAARLRERPPLLLVLGMANSGLQLPPGISAVYVGLFSRGHGVWSWYAGFYVQALSLGRVLLHSYTASQRG